MPRKALTPETARRQVGAHVKASREALKVLSSPDASDGARMDAAKVLEAAGCYIRRATAKGLLS